LTEIAKEGLKFTQNRFVFLLYLFRAKEATLCPRLGFAWPSPAYLRGPALADRQPAWESGLVQRILAEKMGG